VRAVRIVLRTAFRCARPTAAPAELTELGTDLPGTAMLDANGVLEFAFGGRLRVAASETGPVSRAVYRSASNTTEPLAPSPAASYLAWMSRFRRFLQIINPLNAMGDLGRELARPHPHRWPLMGVSRR
jgi:hypothetical protein